MSKLFEFINLLITGIGLLVSYLSLKGVFSNKKRIAFFEKIFKTEESIRRQGEIFEDFLKSFPPKDPNIEVTMIMPRRMDFSNTGRDPFSSVYYKENGLPGKYAVATESEVKEWAYKTKATQIGLTIAILGFVFQVFKYIYY